MWQRKNIKHGEFEREERLPVTKAEVEELVLRAVTTKINQCLQKASETTTTKSVDVENKT